MPHTVPTMMKAISIAEPGGPAVLRAIDYPVPHPGTSEVLVRVHAAGVNRPDVLQRLGRYPVPPGASPLPGLEVAGEIVAGADAGRDAFIGGVVMMMFVVIVVVAAAHLRAH